MKMYETKREITLSDAITRMFIDNVPGHDFEYMVSFDEVDRLIAFGKSWTKQDPAKWGELVPKLWVHREYCPTIPYNDKDQFLVNLLSEPYMDWTHGYKRFHIWERI